MNEFTSQGILKYLGTLLNIWGISEEAHFSFPTWQEDASREEEASWQHFSRKAYRGKSDTICWVSQDHLDIYDGIVLALHIFLNFLAYFF